MESNRQIGKTQHYFLNLVIKSPVNYTINKSRKWYCGRQQSQHAPDLVARNKREHFGGSSKKLHQPLDRTPPIFQQQEKDDDQFGSKNNKKHRSQVGFK